MKRKSRRVRKSVRRSRRYKGGGIDNETATFIAKHINTIQGELDKYNSNDDPEEEDDDYIKDLLEQMELIKQNLKTYLEKQHETCPDDTCRQKYEQILKNIPPELSPEDNILIDQIVQQMSLKDRDDSYAIDYANRQLEDQNQNKKIEDQNKNKNN